MWRREERVGWEVLGAYVTPPADLMYRKSNVLEFTEGLGVRWGPRDSLKALGFKAKCYCLDVAVYCTYDVTWASSRSLRVFWHGYSLVEPCLRRLLMPSKRITQWFSNGLGLTQAKIMMIWKCVVLLFRNTWTIQCAFQTYWVSLSKEISSNTVL